MKELKPEHKAFLDDLAAVCEKHGMVIGGCGCCGSPWVCDAPDGDGKLVAKFGWIDGIGGPNVISFEREKDGDGR